MDPITGTKNLNYNRGPPKQQEDLRKANLGHTALWATVLYENKDVKGHGTTPACDTS